MTHQNRDRFPIVILVIVLIAIFLTVFGFAIFSRVLHREAIIGDDSIHYGVYPSIISELAAWAGTKPYVDLEDLMKKIIAEHYGTRHTDVIEQALRLWSDAYNYAIPTDVDQYGALRTGPAYPFYTEAPADYEAAVAPQDKFAMAHLSSKGMFNAYQEEKIENLPKLEAEYTSQKRMCQMILEGCMLLDGIPDPNEELERLTNMGHFLYHTMTSGLNHKRLVILRTQRDAQTDAGKREEYKKAFRSLLKLERENAMAAIPYSQRDSVLGFEPSLEYIADPARIQWKLQQIDRELEKLTD